MLFLFLSSIDQLIILFQLLCSVDPSILKLTKSDDGIYKEFRADFPDMPVALLNEDELKSNASKEVTEKTWYI